MNKLVILARKVVYLERLESYKKGHNVYVLFYISTIDGRYVYAYKGVIYE